MTHDYKRPWHQKACMRVHPDGKVEVFFRHPGAETDIWREHHSKMWPTCALLVNDELVTLGTHYKSLEEVSASLKASPIAKLKERGYRGI